MFFGPMCKRIKQIKKFFTMQEWQEEILEKEGFNKRKDFVHWNNMNPVDDIKRGDIIEMTRTGKEFFVESITPLGVVLKECTRYVSFSKAALSERLKRKAAIHKSI